MHPIDADQMTNSVELELGLHRSYNHIAFGVDPMHQYSFLSALWILCISTVSCLHSYLLNQWIDFDQTGIDTLLGLGEEAIRFW